jgi:hypothetical protein
VTVLDLGGNKARECTAVAGKMICVTSLGVATRNSGIFGVAILLFGSRARKGGLYDEAIWEEQTVWGNNNSNKSGRTYSGLLRAYTRQIKFRDSTSIKYHTQLHWRTTNPQLQLEKTLARSHPLLSSFGSRWQHFTS